MDLKAEIADLQARRWTPNKIKLGFDTVLGTLIGSHSLPLPAAAEVTLSSPRLIGESAAFLGKYSPYLPETATSVVPRTVTVHPERIDEEFSQSPLGRRKGGLTRDRQLPGRKEILRSLT